MSTEKNIVKVILPEGYTFSYSKKKGVLSGKKGEVTKTMFYPGISLKVEGSEVSIIQKTADRKYKRVSKTFASHIKNMIKGLNEGWSANLKVVYSHFPITVKVEDGEVKVINLFGGSKPRKTKVIKGTDVKVNGKDITVTGNDIELVGQMAANIERLTKLSGLDRRKFQDGIFITKKPKAE